VTLEEQLAHFDQNWDKAYARSLRDFKRRKEEIRAEGRRRIIQGFPIYGAQGYSWPYERLDTAELQEFADAPNYRLMKMKQGWT
jgi:hypothetical protein